MKAHRVCKDKARSYIEAVEIKQEEGDPGHPLLVWGE